MLITNVTDAPGKDPTQVDIYNKTLSPGSQIKLPVDLITQKIRSLEANGLIAIGNLPPWYITAKRRTGKPLSAEERQKRQVTPVISKVKTKEKEGTKSVTEVVDDSTSRKSKE